MALYPEAKVDLITKGTATALTRVDGYLAHTGVASGDTLIRMAKDNGYGGNTWHFAMDHAGNVTQLVDTKHRANCQVDGNWRLLSCEHADYGDGFPKWNLNDASQVPAFTAAQVESEIELQLWLIRTHGFPARLMQTSKGEQGIGYHKLGCDPYRVSGGEKWSSSYGKVCPGTRRIDQLQTVIFPEVQRRLSGASPTPTIPALRRRHAMFLYALKNAEGKIGSDVRIFNGKTPAGLGSNVAEIGKALNDGTYVALIGPGLVEALTEASK